MKISILINKILASPFLLALWVYQKLVSPLLPPACIYYPTCSEYSKQALVKHGVLLGLVLTLSRVLRCNSFFSGGIDEVPETFTILKDRKNG